jgi:hypothetical protein
MRAARSRRLSGDGVITSDLLDVRTLLALLAYAVVAYCLFSIPD